MLSAIGKEISLVHEHDLTKVKGTDKFVPRLHQTLEGWAKSDPPTMKKLPVEADIPEQILKWCLLPGATSLMWATGDWCLIAFYWLLRIGEYTVKGSRNETKQTVQFKMEDVTFFDESESGKITKLPWSASDEEIMAAASATLKLDNQKNGWKGVCVHHEANGDTFFCPVRALGRRYCSIRRHTSDRKTMMSAYWINGERHDLRDEDVRAALKKAAADLNYAHERGIPVERIDTHSLRAGGANAMSLAGYTDWQIRKTGRWRGKTFKEYIREELHCFSKGMSKSMKKLFRFVNVAGGAYHDVTSTVMATRPNSNAAAA